MGQMVRLVTAADDGVLVGHRALICDRDLKWSRAVRQQLGEAGIRVILTPERAPNANAYAERFVRSIKEECLDRMIPVGERHFRRAVAAEWTGYRAVPRFEGTAAREPRVLTPLGLPLPAVSYARLRTCFASRPTWSRYRAPCTPGPGCRTGTRRHRHPAR